MATGMSAAPDEFRPAVRRRVRYALALCCALTAPVFLPAAAALAADDRADQQVPETVVGELLQAWPEPESAHDAADHGHDGPLSWVRTAAGEAVRVPTEDLGGVPAGARVELTVGDSVPDEASAEDGFEPPREVLAAEMVQAPPTAEARPLPATGRTNAVTVVMVAPAGAQPDGTTLGQVVSQVDGPVSRFWSEQTGGAVRVGVADAHDWLTTTAGCSNPTALWAEVAAKVGFTSGAGRHLLLYVSGSADLPGCFYALGEVGSGPGSGGASYVRDAMPSLIAHELGHNFGLGHSSAVQCDGPWRPAPAAPRPTATTTTSWASPGTSSGRSARPTPPGSGCCRAPSSGR